jgi:transposase
LRGWSDESNKLTRYSGEVKERAVRMVFEHRAQYDQREGPSTEEKARIKALERDVRELRQANEILRRASAYFAQAELDRRCKP